MSLVPGGHGHTWCSQRKCELCHDMLCGAGCGQELFPSWLSHCPLLQSWTFRMDLLTPRELKIASYGPIATCGAASRQVTTCSSYCTQIPKKKLARTLHLLEGQWLLLSKPGAGKLSSLQSMSSGIIQLQDSVSLESQPVPLGLAAASALISISDIAEAGLTMDPLN